MPIKLPDFQSLGEAPSLRSGRGVATFDTTAIGKGMQSFGEGVSALAKGVGNYAQKENKEADTLNEAKASAHYLTNRAVIDRERDDDMEPDGIEGRYAPRYKTTLDEAANFISDPQKRELFKLRYSPDVEGRTTAVKNRGFSLLKDREIASTQGQLDDLGKRYNEAKDEGERVEIINTGRGLVDGLRKAGYLDDTKAQSVAKQWVERRAIDWFTGLQPEDKIAALQGPVKLDQRSKTAVEFFTSRGWSSAQASGIVGNLVAESRLNTGARNQGDGTDGSDSIGMAQWNAERAVRLRRYAEARGKPWSDFETQLEFIDLELRTTHASDKLLKATTAREAAAAFVTDFEKPAGSNRGAEFSHGWKTRSGAAEALEAQMGGGKAGSTSPMAGFLPGDRKALIREAESDYRRQLRGEEADAKNRAAGITSILGDDIASIEKRGVGVKDLKREDVVAALGEEGAADWEAQRGRSMKIFEALDGIDTLPDGEVEQRLRQLEPKAGAPGFIEDNKAYETARKKADKFLEARRADPALAVDAFEPVKAARAAAEYEGEGDKRSIAPASAQAIVRARVAAQQQLGIAEPMAVTRSEARTIARQLRFIGDDDDKGMERFVRQLRSTYGDLADEVLTSSLVLENVNRDLAVLATDVVNKITSGKLPGIAEARQFEIAAENQGLTSAMSGKAQAPQQRAPSTADRIDTYTQGLDRQDALKRAGPKPGMPEPTTFDAEDIRWLDKNRASPDALMNFDLKYGPKAGQRILADIDRRKGVKK